MKLTTIGTGILLLILATDALGQRRRQADRSRSEFPQNLDLNSTQNLIERKVEDTGSAAYSGIFQSVQHGITQGNVKVFSQHFGSQVFVSLPSGENGYFSANQAYSILQNYLGSRRIQSFRFSTYGESETAPYATGPGRFEARGNAETVQVYASLSTLNGRWILSQVSIY